MQQSMHLACNGASGQQPQPNISKLISLAACANAVHAFFCLLCSVKLVQQLSLAILSIAPK